MVHEDTKEEIRDKFKVMGILQDILYPPEDKIIPPVSIEVGPGYIKAKKKNR